MRSDVLVSIISHFQHEVSWYGGERSVARGLKCLQKFKTQGLNLAGAQALSFTWEVQVAAVHLQGGITAQLHSFLHRQ